MVMLGIDLLEQCVSTVSYQYKCELMLPSSDVGGMRIYEIMLPSSDVGGMRIYEIMLPSSDVGG